MIKVMFNKREFYLAECERLRDHNLVFAFEYNETPFPITDVISVLAYHEGKAPSSSAWDDEEDWAWILALKEGYGFAVGSCTFSGWDCQSHLDVQVCTTVEEALDKSGEYRKEFLVQIEEDSRPISFRSNGLE